MYRSIYQIRYYFIKYIINRRMLFVEILSCFYLFIYRKSVTFFCHVHVKNSLLFLGIPFEVQEGPKNGHPWNTYHRVSSSSVYLSSIERIISFVSLYTLRSIVSSLSTYLNIRVNKHISRWNHRRTYNSIRTCLVLRFSSQSLVDDFLTL